MRFGFAKSKQIKIIKNLHSKFLEIEIEIEVEVEVEIEVEVELELEVEIELTPIPIPFSSQSCVFQSLLFRKL